MGHYSLLQCVMHSYISFLVLLFWSVLLDKILITVYQFHNLLGKKTYRTEHIYTQVVCKEVHYHLVGNGNKLETS